MATIFSENQLTLGGAIKELRRLKPGCRVSLEFSGLIPKSLASYRGFYDHLALGFGEPGFVPANELWGEFERAVGHAFTGYKGGTYIARYETPIWIANWGMTSDMAMTGITTTDDGSWALIKTERIDC